MNCDILKIVRGNDFATQMTITALDAAGNVIEDFSLEGSTDVVVKYTLAGQSHNIGAYDYDIEGNDITIQWSDLALGKYGFEIEGKFNGYSWLSAARFIFQIVADNASANIPDGVLVDGVYKLNDWLRLLSGTGGGIKQVQANWDETDTKSPAYIQNKPDLNEKQDVLVSGTNIKTINNISLLGEGNVTIVGELMREVSYDYYDTSFTTNIRIRFIYTGIAGAKVSIIAQSGYEFGISIYDVNPPRGTALYDSGWRTGSFSYDVPTTGVQSMTINTRKSDDSPITFEESSANITKVVNLGFIAVTNDIERGDRNLVTSDAIYRAINGAGTLPYQGRKVMLNEYCFKGEMLMGIGYQGTSGQGACVYGDYYVQGGVGGYVRVFNLSTKTVVANSIPLSVVASTNHVNNINFSDVMPTGGTFPYMYVSECTGEGRCFVENFSLSGCALVQTIGYSGTDLHDTNWAIDTENNFIYLIGNTESSYTVQGNKVRVKRFALPALTESDVTLTPEDILDTFDWDGDEGKACVFQGNIVKNGKMYSCFGGSMTTHRIYVTDLDTHITETIIELDQMFDGECESVNIYNGTLLIGYPNQSKLYQLTF